MRSASGAKISIVSLAIRRFLSSFLKKDMVRILCVRSASLTSNTRTSSLIASNSFRKFSAWALLGDDFIARRLNLVTPSTNCATSLPNISSSCSKVTPQSSTVSCNNAVTTVSRSKRISMRICATAMGWVKYGSPDARVWPPWALRPNSKARASFSLSNKGSYSFILSISGCAESNITAEPID